MLSQVKAGAKLSAFLHQCKSKINVITFSNGCGCLKEITVISFLEPSKNKSINYYYLPHTHKNLND